MTLKELIEKVNESLKVKEVRYGSYFTFKDGIGQFFNLPNGAHLSSKRQDFFITFFDRDVDGRGESKLRFRARTKLVGGIYTGHKVVSSIELDKDVYSEEEVANLLDSDVKDIYKERFEAAKAASRTDRERRDKNNKAYEDALTKYGITKEQHDELNSLRRWASRY